MRWGGGDVLGSGLNPTDPGPIPFADHPALISRSDSRVSPELSVCSPSL